MIKLVGLGTLILALALAGMAIDAWLRTPGALPPQPIEFNHRLHMERAQGITCEDCHHFVASQPYAGIPSKHVCFDCHDPSADAADVDADANKPQFATLMSFRDTQEDIPWHRVTGTRPDVFFSHRMHVTVADLDCRQCHAAIADSTRPSSHGPEIIEMETCLRCHEEHGASEDCVACHR
jgi:hypothetical protein